MDEAAADQALPGRLALLEGASPAGIPNPFDFVLLAKSGLLSSSRGARFSSFGSFSFTTLYSSVPSDGAD